jgi:ADP-ribose pyrophosphatase YjhB (NUDIX family)
MKKLWQKLGIVVFWLSWPVSYIYLHGSERTRVLLMSGDQILLVQDWHSDGKWSLPGGGLRKGENRVAGAVRELQEEVGLQPTPQQLKPIASSVYRHHGLTSMNYYFLATLPEPMVVRTHFPEIIAAKWIDYHKVSLKDVAPDVQTALQAWTGGNLLQ